MIGTTDVRFEEDPDLARCDIGEAEYLLDEVNALIPEANLTVDDVLYTLSGVRPLPYEPGVPESSITRTHVLHDHAASGLPGLVTVVGGKLTTFRQLAQDAVDDVLRRLGRTDVGCSTGSRPLPGAVGYAPDRLHEELVGRGASAAVASRLLSVCGSAAREVWALAESDQSLAVVVHPGSSMIGAEVVHAVTREHAVTLSDVLARRTLTAFEPGHGLESLDGILAVLTPVTGWDDARTAEEIEGYREWLSHLAIPDPEGPRSESFGAGEVTSGASEGAGSVSAGGTRS